MLLSIAGAALMAGGDGEGVALLKDRSRDEPTAFVCRAYACDAPTSDASLLQEQLRAARGPSKNNR